MISPKLHKISIAVELVIIKHECELLAEEIHRTTKGWPPPLAITYGWARAAAYQMQVINRLRKITSE